MTDLAYHMGASPVGKEKGQRLDLRSMAFMPLHHPLSFVW
jgi:hypothetical protein